MAKRKFVQRARSLEDAYDTSRGEHVVVEVEISEEMRAEVLRQGTPLDASVGRDTKPASVDELLSSLREGIAVAPGALVPFAGDPRVRAALLEEARTCPPERLANVAEAVAALGGPQAVEVLRHWLHRLAEDPTTFEDASFFNWKAGSLTSVAGGLAALGTHTADALEALRRLLRHPCRANRKTAAARLADVTTSLAAEWQKTALADLEACYSSDDPAMFACVAPAFVGSREGAVFDRCEALLSSEDSAVRELAAVALQKMEHPRATSLLEQQLPRESSLRLAVRIAAQLGPKAWSASRIEIARRALADESPSLRLAGAAVLRTMQEPEARSVAKAALADEPDAWIRSQLAALSF